MSKLIVVLGITQIQGESVANAFLSKDGWKVRGISRNLSSDASKSLARKGVEMVRGDLNDIASLRQAFEGAHVIFGVTSHASIRKDPAVSANLKPGQTMSEAVYEAELQHAKDLAGAASEVSTLEAYIWSTLPFTDGQLLHFDSKSAASNYIKANIPQLAEKMRELLLPSWFELMTWDIPLRPWESSNGSYRMTVIDQAHKSLVWASASFDTGSFVWALTTAKPGTLLYGESGELSFDDMLATFCKVRGVENGGVEIVSVDEWASRLDLNPSFANMVASSFQSLSNGGLTPKQNDGSLTHPAELGIEPTDWAAFCKKTDWSKPSKRL